MSRTLAQDLNAVNAIHVSLMPSDILIRLFSNLYPPPIYGDPPPLNIFGAISDKHVFSSISYTWGSWLITHHSPFLTGRSCCWLVQPHTVPFWGRGSTSNVCITLSNLLKILFSFFFFSNRIRESLLSKPGCWQRLSWLSVSAQVRACQIFPKCNQEKLKLFHRLLLVPQLVLKSVCLLSDTPVGKTLSGSLGIWCWKPQLWQRHFCS